MELTSAQVTIAKDTHRFRILCTGRRFGKTTLSVEELKHFALSKESNLAYIAPTYQQSRDIAWSALVKILDKSIIDKNESRLELTVICQDGKGKSKISLRGWESIDTLRGQAFDFLVIDEVAMMRNFNEKWQEVIRPTLTDRKGQVMFISTPKGYNHFYDLYQMEKKDSDYKSFHFTSYDNPFIPREEIDKASKEITEDRFAQEYLASFTKTEGLVYKEFSRFKHLFNKTPERIVEYYCGVDWGFTAPAAVHLIGRDYDDNYYVLKEWYHTNKTTEEIIEVAASFKAGSYYPDPAEPDRVEMMRRKGLNVRTVNKDIVAGINSVRDLLAKNKLFIHEDCVNMIYEFETYSYPDKHNPTRQTSGRDKNELPLDDNNHALDELRYVLHMVSSGRGTFNQPATFYNPMIRRI